MRGKLTVGVKWAPKKDAINFQISRPSPLGNPFPITDKHPRDEVCDMYEEYLMDKLNAGDPTVHAPLTYLRDKLKEGVNVHLTCFCKGRGHENRRCHGDFIKSILDENVLEDIEATLAKD